MSNTDRDQLAELREYWGGGDEEGLLRSILNAAVELAATFDEYDRHMRYGIHDASPDLHRMVHDVLLSSMRASCSHIRKHSPMVGQTLDDIRELLAE